MCKHCPCMSMEKDMKGYNPEYRIKQCKKGNEENLGEIIKRKKRYLGSFPSEGHLHAGVTESLKYLIHYPPRFINFPH